METTTKGTTDTTTQPEGTEKKARQRVNPHAKMVKALHSILGEQVRNNEWDEAASTLEDMQRHLVSLNNG